MVGEPWVAAVFLLRDDGAVLLQHRDDKPDISHPGQWVPPAPTMNLAWNASSTT